MPLYVYRCPNCQKQAEVILTLKEAEQPLECDTCHVDAHRVITAPSSIQFKGDGWTSRG